MQYSNWIYVLDLSLYGVYSKVERRSSPGVNAYGTFVIYML